MNLEVPFVSEILVGVYYDFNQNWFGDIGAQVTSVMITNAIFPPFEQFLLWLWSYAKRAYD